MDKRKGILNISASIASKILLLLAALYMRRLLIIYIGNEVNGLNSLYGSIIGLLSVAELGVGSAIVFSMYSPIVQNDKKKIAALYGLYNKLYHIIGGVIFAAGLALIPFLPQLIEDYDSLDINVSITFLLTLISVVLSYLYSARSSLIEAHKNNYITTGIGTASRMLRYGMQIAAILIWKSFVIFLICQIIETLIVWFVTELVVRKLYPDIIRMHERLDTTAKKEVAKNIKAMFMHKIGAVLVGAIDSMIISAYIGVAILGKYTNYTAVAGAMSGIITLIFTPLTSVIGHFCAANKPDDIRSSFYHFYSLNYVIGVVFFLGYYAVVDYVVAICFGNNLTMPKVIPFVITVNQFILYMRYAPILFRDATGTFYYDRWKPVAEGLVNLILSLLLVNILPDEYRVVGVIVATIITTLVICDTIEPHILYKYVFHQSPKRFYLTGYGGIALFTVCVFLLGKMKVSCSSNLLGLILNGAISLVVSAVILCILGLLDRNFRQECRTLLEQMRRGIRRIRQHQ